MVAPEDDDDASKTEEPSERKISKAKEEGEVAISQEAKSFIMLLGMLFVVWLLIPLMFKWFYLMSVRFVENAGQMPVDQAEIEVLLRQSGLGLLKIILFLSRFSLCSVFLPALPKPDSYTRRKNLNRTGTN